jgi:hypothetical protein
MAAIKKDSHIRTKVSINSWSQIVKDYEDESNRFLDNREKIAFEEKERIIKEVIDEHEN